MKPRVEFSSKGRKRAFLRTYSKIGKLAKTAEKVGVSTNAHYKWLKNDPEYAEDWLVACEISADNLEDSLYERAVNGVTRETGWYQGKAGGTYVDYSDTAAIFLLKGKRPWKYADRQRTDVNVTHNINVDQARAKLSMLLERNPDLAGKIGGMLGDVKMVECDARDPQDGIYIDSDDTDDAAESPIYIDSTHDEKTDEGGVGPQTRGVLVDKVPPPTSGNISAKNTVTNSSLTGTADLTVFEPPSLDVLPPDEFGSVLPEFDSSSDESSELENRGGHIRHGKVSITDRMASARAASDARELNRLKRKRNGGGGG